MKRTDLILGGVLLFQLVLILLFRSPIAGASSDVEARPLVPALEAITPSRIELMGAEDDAKVTLVREGGGWQIEEMGGFPANETKIDQLVEDLKQVKVRRPVVRGSRYHKTFKVTENENEARLKIWSEGDDDPQVDLIFGSTSNYRAIHARLSGEDPVYELRGIASYDVRADSNAWIRKELVSGSQDDVVSLRLENPSGTFEIGKRDGSWEVIAPDDQVGRELDQDKVDSLVRAAASVQLAEAVGPVDPAAHGLASPAASVRLRLSDAGGQGTEEEVTIQVGPQLEDRDSHRYVTRAGFGFTGTVWNSSVEQLVGKTIDELLL